jgi:hypothetical protein
MSDLLSDYECKRRRAMLHYDVLRKQVEGFTNVDRHLIRGERQSDPVKHLFKLPPERSDPVWTLLLGDFLYNTRASLDYLITALVRSTGNHEHSGSQFPIYAEVKGVSWENMPQWWEDAREVDRKLKDAPAGTKAAIKQLQPFNGAPFASLHPLAVLNALNNRDKHRRLNLLARRVTFEFQYPDGKPVFQAGEITDRITQRDEGNAYVVQLTVTPDKANMDVYLLAVNEVTLDEGFQAAGDLIETLTGINEFIDGRVLPTVRRLLA